MEPPVDVKDRLRASYNAITPAYNAWTARHNELRMKYLGKLLKSCPELESAGNTAKKQVLELGCGSGSPFISTLLARAPSVYVHVNDLSNVQLGLARHNLAAYQDRVEFHPGDMMKLDFAPGSLTAVVALYSIIHLPQEEQREMIRRIGRWLAPGGVFLSTFGTDEASVIIDEKWIDEKGWMFWSALGKEGVIKALTQEAGLEVQHAVLEEDADDKFLWIISKKANI
ncbi:methyltransferase [Fusarium subglutinans]|uniref:Methyltransferase n=1 Tax=Gibberella subglutinans TaxID=42677 RepID=A0A8H5PCF2_GIBSU|nr:methyltransferase [Fusarium subglutinans]KAF5594132.1 methyltransferase [Fusarium subglutinans]